MHTTKVAVPISLITSMTTMITTRPPLTSTTTRRTQNFKNSRTGIEEDTVTNAYGPEGLEYEGLEYGRYELEAFEHLGYKPGRTKFEGTTGGDVENIKNKSQRLRFEPDKETQGRYTHPVIAPTTYTCCQSPQPGPWPIG